MESKSHDLVVIGAGPGGYIAAIRAAQLGLNVACVEKETELGGTCLRIGCIPSKALLESSERYDQTKRQLTEHGVVIGDLSFDIEKMMKRKDKIVKSLTGGVKSLFKKNGVTTYYGTATFENANRILVENSDFYAVEAKNFIIATGSVSAPLKGVELDGDRIGTSTEGLSYPEVPEHLVVIGAGYIGLEMGSVWLRLGSKVTVLEYLDRILPGADTEIASEAFKIFKKQGFDFQLGARVTGAKKKKGGCVVETEGMDPVECDRVLLSVGRIPNTEGLGLKDTRVEKNDRGRIVVNEHFQTAEPNIYAIGDVIEGPMLAHKAEDEGVACVEYIVNGYGHVNYDAIPSVVYTHPEVASVGKTEDQLKDDGVPYNKGAFPFVANGRAKALGDTGGFIKVLAHKETDRVLGVHIIGPRAGDLIAEAAVAIEFGASSEDIARASHAHPTLAEALREAALAVDERALNF